jgi:hypothetical protein
MNFAVFAHTRKLSAQVDKCLIERKKCVMVFLVVSIFTQFSYGSGTTWRIDRHIIFGIAVKVCSPPLHPHWGGHAPR